MAKANQQTEPEKPVNQTHAPRPPAGFTNEGRPDIDGWLKASEGLVVHGRIAGFFSFIQRNRDGKDKVREVICVRLLQPCVASKEGGELVQLVGGQTLAMSIMYCLEPLKVYVEHRGEVWIQFKSKQSIGGGHAVWKADVFGKGTKAAAPLPVHQAPLPTSDVNGAGDEPWDN